MQEIASTNLLAKSMLAVWEALRRPSLARRLLSQAYNERIVSRGAIAKVDIASIVGSSPEILLVDFVPEPGNVSPLELLCLCSLIRHLSPRQVLELGTFNGNTALQFAANLGEDARVATLDLAPDAAPIGSNNAHDAVLVRAASRQRPRFLDSKYATRVTQHYGDTLTTDFAALTEHAPDFIFIDAGHTDECVRNDTRKSLAALAPGGTIVWHDYTQDWPDVFNFLTELSARLPLQHIAGTNIVIFRDQQVRQPA